MEQWKYFEELVNYQDRIGLHAGIKIRSRHISYHKEKMKVRLAAQTFSMSVANALTFCSTTLNLEQFKDSETTVQFCKTINNIFDFLNTRNFLSKSEYQKPLKSSNEEKIKLFIKNSIEYLQSLKCENKNKEKILLVKSQRKTGFLGFIICLQSVYNIFEDTVKPGILDFYSRISYLRITLKCSSR